MMLLPILMAVQMRGDDSGLVARMQRRDPQALAELYDRYGGVTYSLILRVVRDTGIAEDLVQETFLRVESRKRIRCAEGFHRPLVAGGGAQSGHRLPAQRRRKERNAIEYEETDHPSLYCDMEKDILASDKARKIRSAIDKLPANYRQVIELAYFEGLSQTEMAERMSQPLGTVKTWVRSALKNLRDELAVVSV